MLLPSQPAHKDTRTLPQAGSGSLFRQMTPQKNITPSILGATPNRYRHILFNIPHLAIAEANQAGEIKALAVFYCLKRLYSNSCIYNYNHHLLAKKTGLSITAIKRYITIFKEKEWLREHQGNLTFLRPEGSKFATFTIKNTNPKLLLNQIKIHINYEILKTKTQQIEYIIAARKDQKEPATLKALKSANRLLFKQSFAGEISEEIKISIYKFAEVFKCSLSKASAILSELVSYGFIRFIKNTKILFSDVSCKFYKSIKDQLKGYCYFSNNQIIQVNCRTLLLNDYLVKGIFQKEQSSI